MKALVNTQATLSSVQLQQVIEHFKQDDSSLLQAYSEYAADNNYDSVYDNDDDTINMIFADSHEALRAAFYGDYNPIHAYFTFNGYGNLQSFEYLDSEQSPIDIEELSQWIIDNDLFNDYDIEVTTLDDMLNSIEDNITDNETMLNKLVIKSDIKLECFSVVMNNGYSSYNDYTIGECLLELKSYDYNQLQDIITHLGINYE